MNLPCPSLPLRMKMSRLNMLWEFQEEGLGDGLKTRFQILELLSIIRYEINKQKKKRSGRKGHGVIL